jgi:hypothetical protein
MLAFWRRRFETTVGTLLTCAACGNDTGASGSGSSLDNGTTSTGSSTTSATTACGTGSGDDLGGFLIAGGGDTDLTGHAVAGAGDVNGDGLDDVIVSAHLADHNGAESGRIYVVFGKADDGTVMPGDLEAGIGGFVIDGEKDSDWAGSDVGSVGDLNGDGLADIIVGASGADPAGEDSGRAYVLFGREDTATVSLADVAIGVGGFAMDGEAAGDHAGARVSGAGDVNGDGVVDLVVAATQANPNGTDSGRTYLVFGNDTGAQVSLAEIAAGQGGFAIDGEAAEDDSGAVRGAGDVNGDGLQDIIIGAPHAEDYTGRAYVVFGKTSTDGIQLAGVADGAGGFALLAEAAGDWVGLSAAGIGDLNADGLSDIVVGASRSGVSGEESGRAYVVFGKADGEPVLLGDVAAGVGGFTVDGEAAGDRAGASVDGTGDINGDGQPDIIIGAYRADVGATDTGRAYAVFGKENGEPVALADVVAGVGGLVIDPDPSSVDFGYVSGARDVNADGVPDMIIGAPTADTFGQHFGYARVVFGPGADPCE